MAKPVLFPISAFDATKDQVLSFTYSGNPITKCEAVFYNNETGASVYGEGVYSVGQKLEYRLAAGSLSNSNTPYNVKLRVYDLITDASEYSDLVQFYCVAKPTFKFNGLNSSAVNDIANSRTVLKVSYTPAENSNEQLNSYFIGVYDANYNQIVASDTYFNAELPYDVAGLQNGVTYYVRAIGQTQHNMTLDTGYVGLRANYAVSSTYSHLLLTNDYQHATVDVKSNISAVEGGSVPANPEFETGKNGQAVVLTEPGSKVVFNDAINAPDSFAVCTDLIDFKPYQDVLTLTTTDGEIRTKLIQRELDGFDKAQTYLLASHYKDGEMTGYNVYSNYIEYTEPKQGRIAGKTTIGKSDDGSTPIQGNTAESLGVNVDTPLFDGDYLYTDEHEAIEYHKKYLLTFDGTENWEYIVRGAEPYFRLRLLDDDDNSTSPVTDGKYMICSHYTKNTDEHMSTTDQTFSFYNVVRWNELVILDSRFTTDEDFKKHLAELSASGSPLSILYSLEKPLVSKHRLPLPYLRAWVKREADGTMDANLSIID